MLFWQLLPTSHRILLALAALYFVNIATRGILTQWLALAPFSSVGTGQYWRFVSYPFASSGFWEMLSTSAVLYFFAPEAERILTPRRFLLALCLFVIIHALVFAPLLIFTKASLMGTGAIALFILTMYIYIYPSGEVSLFGIIPMRATMLLCLMFVVAIASSVMNFSLNPAAIAHAFANEGFGIFFGFIFSHLYFGRFSSRTGGGLGSLLSFTQNRPAPDQQTQPRRAAAPSPASVGRSSSGAAETQSLERRVMPIHAAEDDDNALDEDRLNEILDKINEKGQQSLTSAEQEFLKDYANRLQ